MRIKCNTIGELKQALNNWPDDKLIIYDEDGDTFGIGIEDWSDEPANDINWPVNIFHD